jgi:hypothetical protein
MIATYQEFFFLESQSYTFTSTPQCGVSQDVKFVGYFFLPALSHGQLQPQKELHEVTPASSQSHQEPNPPVHKERNHKFRVSRGGPFCLK